MNLDPQSLRLARAVLITAAIIIVMGVAAEVLKPIALAILLAFILTPLVDWFQRRGIPHAVSVVLAILLPLAALGGIGYVVGAQIASLAASLPQYEHNIMDKLSRIQPGSGSPIEQISETASHVRAHLDPTEGESTPRVRVVNDSLVLQRVETILTPFQTFFAFTGVVLLLLFFLLLQREDVNDRLSRLVGRGHIGLTTKTLRQIDLQLSRYLATFALYNMGYGVVVGIGLWALGIKYALVWGTLAGFLRFIPYLGPLVAIALPTVFAVAESQGWREPTLVLVLFGVTEVVSNSLEPIIYSKSAGVSSLGLLVAALFWAWLWGGLGLLMAAPLTVCLAVLGEHIRSLSFLATLLGHDIEVDDDLKWYQRVLSHDQDGAYAFLDEMAQEHPIEEVFERAVIPALARAKEDRARGALDREDQAVFLRLVHEWLDDAVAQRPLGPGGPSVSGPSTLGPVIGIAAAGEIDALVLRMINFSLLPTGVQITILEPDGSPLEFTDLVSEQNPATLIVSHVPPTGQAHTRYLLRRLMARLPEVPLILGYWAPREEFDAVADQYRTLGVHKVATSVTAAREMILGRTVAEEKVASPALA